MEPQTQATPPPKTPKHRSPSYPAIDLEKALERTKQLASVAGNHAAPVSAALSAWSYSAKSSGGMLTLAAVKKYGLAEDEGAHASRQLRVTQLGKELAFYDSDRTTSEWTKLAQTAALTPSIHKELWDKYEGQLPADSVIRPYLVLERGFSESAAAEVLRILHHTLTFAKIEAGSLHASVSEDEPDADENGIVKPAAIAEPEAPASAQQQSPREVAKPVKQQERTVQVPYSPGEWALVQAAFPLTEAAWTQMIAVLEAMKPGLVVADER
jgi:hypothetical protein